MAKPALGRGLDALLSGTSQPLHVGSTANTAGPTTPTGPAQGSVPGRDVVQLPVNRIRPSSVQPRKEFSEEAIRELADSIRAHGVMQPVLVRPRGDFYELIAGERRWRAAQLCGLETIPALVHVADDRTALELALIENLQREDLNPMDEAAGYATLLEQFQLTQEEISRRVGKSRATIANALRLLKLPAVVQEHVRAGRLSAGHAKALLGIDDPTIQVRLAERIIKEHLSVRQVERAVAALQTGRRQVRNRTPETTSAQSPFIRVLEERLRQRLATKVSIQYSSGQGVIEIRFFSDDDLNRILQLLGVTPE